MKKFISIILIISLFSAVSCEKKQNTPDDTFSDTPVIRETSREQEEDIFHEYTAEDFREINITAQGSFSNNPADMTKIELTGIDFGERRSKCKDTINSNEADINTNFALEGENYGNPDQFAIDGDMLYIGVNYDSMHYPSSHEYAFFSYNMKNHETKEICSFSDEKDVVSFFDMNFVDGKLYLLQGYGGKYTRGRLCTLDVDSGEINLLSEEYFSGMYCSDERVVLYDCEEDIIIKEYDTQKGSIEEIYSDHNYKNGLPMMKDEGLVYIEKNENRRCTIKSDKYTIDTGVKGLILCGISDNHVSAIQNGDYGKKILYTYDLSKMECYIAELGALKSIYYSVGENLIAFDEMNYFYYYVPEMALYFMLLNQPDFATVRSNNKTVDILYYETKSIFVNDGSGTVHFYQPDNDSEPKRELVIINS